MHVFNLCRVISFKRISQSVFFLLLIQKIFSYICFSKQLPAQRILGLHVKPHFPQNSASSQSDFADFFLILSHCFFELFWCVSALRRLWAVPANWRFRHITGWLYTPWPAPTRHGAILHHYLSNLAKWLEEAFTFLLDMLEHEHSSVLLDQREIGHIAELLRTVCCPSPPAWDGAIFHHRNTSHLLAFPFLWHIAE